MKTLYFDCLAGASGDMILGALIDAGVSAEKLAVELKKLRVSDFSLAAEKVDRAGITATKAKIELPPEHAHRHLADITEIISEADLSAFVKDGAVKTFTIIAEAEAKIHGTTVEKIHFHEVGAMDAIVDIIGAFIGFEMLGIERFLCSKLHVGSGFVKMAHGKFPVPPPAVAEILQNFSAPFYQTEIEGELLTPTGIAVISAVCESFGAMPLMNATKTFYGAGGRNYKDFPNVLRVVIGETENNSTNLSVSGKSAENNLRSEKLLQLETNFDDISAEILGFVMERALETGALDVWFTPIQMKKNRPAVMLSILCEKKNADALKNLIFTETTTLGIRQIEIERECLEREIVKVETTFGAVDVKVSKRDGKILNAKPEYEQIKQIALQSENSFREIEKQVLEKFAAADAEI